MKYLIFGVGAVGSVFLAFLSKAGYPCVGFTKPNKKIDTIKIDGIWGSFTQKVITIDNLSDSPIKPDIVILSVKSYDTWDALQQLKRIMDENTYLLIAQNGYGNYEAAVSLFGKERVILSRIIFGAKLLEVGNVMVTVSADDVVIGDPSQTIDKQTLEKIAWEINSSGIPTRHDKDVYKYLMDKVIYNCALNPLGALFEVSYGDLVKNPYTKEIIDKIIDEAFEVFLANKVPTFHKSSQAYKELFYERLVPPTAKHYPSMLEDIKKGKTEIDSLNGAIVNLAKGVNLSVPVNEMITKLVKAKEQFIF